MGLSSLSSETRDFKEPSELCLCQTLLTQSSSMGSGGWSPIRPQATEMTRLFKVSETVANADVKCFHSSQYPHS
jgi:hypothetical protein